MKRLIFVSINTVVFLLGSCKAEMDVRRVKEENSVENPCAPYISSDKLKSSEQGVIALNNFSLNGDLLAPNDQFVGAWCLHLTNTSLRI